MSNAPLMTAEQVAVRLNVSPWQARYLIRTGAIPCHRVGKAARVSEEQLQTYLRNCRVDVRGYRFVKGGRRW